MIRKIALAAAPLAALGGLMFSAGAAHADTPPTTVTAVTHVTNRPDNGHGTPSLWAYDTMNRTLTVTLAAPQPKSTPAGDLAYNVSITDKGYFSAIQGAFTPNQSITAGAKIAHHVAGSLNGSYALTVFAPAGDALTGTVPATEDDNFGTPLVTTTDWASQAFATKVGVTVQGGKYEWDYATGDHNGGTCEKWVDSSENGDGNAVADGNITGKICYVPRPYLYGGHAVDIAPTRENVYFSLGGVKTPTWVHFQIFGPGPIDGHQGWVLAQPGENVGVYTGLSANHTYVSFYTPVTGRYSTTQIPGSHGGHVTFISNQG